MIPINHADHINFCELKFTHPTKFPGIVYLGFNQENSEKKKLKPEFD